ncbi:MAG TPA: SGNH/GDSL hydrolase family protein, partial [Bacteroidetes bacterium]|nr:SGNH/GDSL hydrolase family protein [Bacteroidota bacterium]
MSLHHKMSRLGVNITTLIVASLICLVLAEIALRFLWNGYQPYPHEKTGIAYDDTLGWIGEPETPVLSLENGTKIYCHMNRFGFRDEEFPPLEQVSHKTRLLFLGDSFMMGNGIEKEFRASEIVETQDTCLISYNLGITGYSTDQELLLLKKYGPLIQPDYVFLFFCINDLIYNDKGYEGKTAKPLFCLDENDSLKLINLPLPPLPKLNPFMLWIESKFALVQFIKNTRARLEFEWRSRRIERQSRDLRQSKSTTPNARGKMPLPLTDSATKRNITYYLMRELRDECQRLNARLILFTTPSSLAYTVSKASPPRSIERVLDWCNELGIRAIDLYPIFHDDYS